MPWVLELWTFVCRHSECHSGTVLPGAKRGPTTQGLAKARERLFLAVTYVSGTLRVPVSQPVKDES